MLSDLREIIEEMYIIAETLTKFVLTTENIKESYGTLSEKNEVSDHC